MRPASSGPAAASRPASPGRRVMAHLPRHPALLLLLGLAAVMPAASARPPPVKKVTWRVTYEVAAPDCWERPVVLVNGQLGPTLEVVQGEILELTVINDMPPRVPNVAEGISIHFHGWSMRGVPWYDGVAHVEQCPIQPGASFVYRFQVNEMPGTYMWHGHAGNDRADGLTGPLIVRPAKGAVQPVPLQWDEERVLFLSDWWHTAAGPLAMQLSRPFDAARQTNNSGGFVWVGNPQAMLINGRGNYLDCVLGATGSTAPPSCSVQNIWVPPGRSTVQPWASLVNPGCTHENVTVEAGKTYLVRIINSASLVYQTVCFGGHDVTVVAADAVPVEPFLASKFTGCIDINSGQRYDVLLTANQASGNYWISTHVQYRPGSPSGYAVLRYKGAEGALPATPPPQPGSIPAWTIAQEGQVVMSSKLLSYEDKTVAGGEYGEAMMKVPTANVSLLLNITQPLMSQTGQIRWALNNVAGQNPTPCEPLLDLVKADPKWIQKNMVPASKYNANGKPYSSTALGTEEGKTGKVDLFVTNPGKMEPPPVYPTAGPHLVTLKKGQVVELVLQNNAANANNGDYRVPAGAARTAQEQHPFHLHGHHFWVLGQGLGTYNASSVATLNTRNPPLRDTATLPQGGWVVLRFIADNPGMWIFHCHLTWHQMMGQMLVFAEAIEDLPARPKRMPKCPSPCYSNAAPWSNSFVQKEFGGSGFQLPARG